MKPTDSREQRPSVSIATAWQPTLAVDTASAPGTPAAMRLATPEDHGGRRASEPPRILDVADPVTLVNEILVASVRRRASLVALDVEGDGCSLVIRRGNATLSTFRVPEDVGTAAIVRLASAAGLDPVDEDAALSGHGRASRIRVRLGDDHAEFLVTVASTRLGFSAELRPLTVNGREIDSGRVVQLKRCVDCGAYQAPQRARCEHDDGALRELDDNPVPGGTLGAYRVLDLLGSGGMGAVYAGEHALIGRHVAIKILHPSLARSAAAAARFLSEARAASKLRHPCIVEVTDYGVLAGGAAFLVMERLYGVSLESHLAQAKGLEIRVALTLARAVALALAAAHDAGVVHNDLKPSNVMLLGEPTARTPLLKLVDFGAASLLGNRNDADEVVGTPVYMAPERIRGELGDGRSDIYSLGVVLFEMIAGAPPFWGKTAEEVFSGHLVRPPPPLTSPSGVLPRGVVRIVARALAKPMSERYQDMGELAADLERAIALVERPDWRRWLP